MPSSGIYRQRFGSWSKALICAEMEPKKSIPGPKCIQKKIEAKKGKQSCNWKGGKIKDKHGYIHIWEPEHPNANIGRNKAYVLEHRKIMSDFLGRPLKKNETVHHKNGNRSDNRIENLELWSSEHPSGQRVEDKIKWAINFLNFYGFEVIGNIHENPNLIKEV